jgi:peptide/nickel transport system substrate-binding protein
VAKNITLDVLMKIGRDGRMTPGLAESASLAPDGRSLRIRLRPNIKFHDGTPVTSALVAQVIQAKLPRALGSASQDLESVHVVSDSEVDIGQRRWSPFLIESLDMEVEKPGAPGVGTGPYSARLVGDNIEMTANDTYYLGAPLIKRVVIRTYPTVRGAWAEMLRGQVDMLYEVGLDAIDSLQASSQVALYSFPRTYSYVIVLNARNPKFASRELRQALNSAVDRAALVNQGLYGHGKPADGPVYPSHWAFRPTFPAFVSDPAAASKRLGGKLSFTCIVAEGALFERLALTVQKQLAAVGVDMQVQTVPLSDLITRVTQRHDFDAVLFDGLVAPTMNRAYQWWHTGGTFNFSGFSSAKVDAALDAVRYASNDTEYAAAVLDFQRAILDDPPAVFLAWGERVRAVSRRFDVASEPDRDILTNLRLWKPAADQHAANRN